MTDKIIKVTRNIWKKVTYCVNSKRKKINRSSSNLTFLTVNELTLTLQQHNSPGWFRVKKNVSSNANAAGRIQLTNT